MLFNTSAEFSLPTIEKNKKALNETCVQMRLQIAQEVVDICNAVIRRGC